MTPFFRTDPLSYHKFENMVMFRSWNLYTLCSPGNPEYQKIIYFLIFSSKRSKSNKNIDLFDEKKKLKINNFLIILVSWAIMWIVSWPKITISSIWWYKSGSVIKTASIRISILKDIFENGKKFGNFGAGIEEPAGTVENDAVVLINISNSNWLNKPFIWD